LFPAKVRSAWSEENAGAGIDDDQEPSWLSYNEPAWLAQRHGLRGAEPALANLTAALNALAKQAAAE
jgi:hypothetical protein